MDCYNEILKMEVLASIPISVTVTDEKLLYSYKSATKMLLLLLLLLLFLFVCFLFFAN